MSMKEENNDYEEDGNIVELVDEEGNTLRYEHVGTIEYKGEWYCFFTTEAAEATAFPTNFFISLRKDNLNRAGLSPPPCRGNRCPYRP